MLHTDFRNLPDFESPSNNRASSVARVLCQLACSKRSLACFASFHTLPPFGRVFFIHLAHLTAGSPLLAFDMRSLFIRWTPSPYTLLSVPNCTPALLPPDTSRRNNDNAGPAPQTATQDSLKRASPVHATRGARALNLKTGVMYAILFTNDARFRHDHSPIGANSCAVAWPVVLVHLSAIILPSRSCSARVGLARLIPPLPIHPSPL